MFVFEFIGLSNPKPSQPVPGLKAALERRHLPSDNEMHNYMQRMKHLPSDHPESQVVWPALVALAAAKHGTRNH